MFTSRLLIAVAAAALTAGAAHSTVIYSTGFEAPQYATGALGGQNGWNIFGPGAAGISVQNGVAASGTQAVRVNGAQAPSQTGPWRTNATAEDHLSLSADILITSAPGQQGAWQFGALGPGLIGFAGGVNFTAGGNIFAISGAVNPLIGTYVRDQFFNLELVLDYAAQTYAVNLNGANLASGLAFCGGNASCTGAAIPEYRTMIFDRLSGSAGGDVGYLDNVLLQTVPEPATWAMMIGGFFGLGGMLRRRRAVFA